jgi:hypothetical protein
MVGYSISTIGLLRTITHLLASYWLVSADVSFCREWACGAVIRRIDNDVSSDMLSLMFADQ